MTNEKTFTFDVEKIKNGYIIFHNKEKEYRQNSADVNCHIESVLMAEIKDYIASTYPPGTAQRLVVIVGVSGKVME